MRIPSHRGWAGRALRPSIAAAVTFMLQPASDAAEQIRIASEGFTQTVLFAYHPYVDPKKKGKAATLYEWFRDRKR